MSVSSGTLRIVEGLAFFVEKRSLNPVYFGTKLQCLVEALEVRIKLETTNATSDKIMAREVTPPSGPGFSLQDGWVKDSGGHRDHDSDESNPGWQSPPSRSQKSQCQTVSFDDSLDDCNEDHDHSDEDSKDGDDTADIQRRRRKFQNDEINEVVEMFRQFEETKVKPCAQCLGCTITCLMRIGKWLLNTSERRQRRNPWNVYLNLLKEKDEFVLKSEARNSYAKLKNDMGGSDTEAWVAETEHLTSELRGRKTAVGKKKGESGGDVAKLMEQTQRRWNADGKTLLNTSIHTFYMMVSDMASSSAAHSRNTSSMNSPQMESWYKSHFDPTQHIGDIYKYILAQQLRSKEVEALEEGESHRRHIMETQDMHHTKAACAQRMRKLLGPYMLAKVKMYEAFTHPEDRQIRLEELPESPLDSDESMLPVMIDHHGRVQHTIGSVDRARASNDWSGGATLGGEGINSPVLDEVREENVESTMGKRKYSELGRSWDSTGIGPGHAAEDAGERDSDVEEDERPVRRRRKERDTSCKICAPHSNLVCGLQIHNDSLVLQPNRTEIKAPQFQKEIGDPLAAPQAVPPAAPPDPTPNLSCKTDNNSNIPRSQRRTSTSTKDHFKKISIQYWVLEYTNTALESDASTSVPSNMEHNWVQLRVFDTSGLQSLGPTAPNLGPFVATLGQLGELAHLNGRS
ncbi:hypothetical protein BS47DRAFT_1365376 [Hydnum rufescens UP504]|uniref:Uncharacterized protein n=1 Tax=Hydnum rufescens UP504 TaxID=1448309 RepID=A0A9P6ANX1_9AGAM|nr:hypothetical protein BS47DRAFT_1365376 [Hydnum rufescens UP504]